MKPQTPLASTTHPKTLAVCPITTGAARLLLLLLLLFALPVAVRAQFSYTTSNGQITITGYTGSGGVVLLPGTIDDLPVTTIAAGAFSGTDLTSVTIPDSVTSIEDNAFTQCLGLTNVTIGNGVTTIGAYAFRGCTKLTSVTIPDSVTAIEDRTFDGCTLLSSITIGNGVTRIGDGAFNRSNLINVTIPDNVTSIGDYRSRNASACIASPLATVSPPSGARHLAAAMTCKPSTLAIASPPSGRPHSILALSF